MSNLHFYIRLASIPLLVMSLFLHEAQNAAAQSPDAVEVSTIDDFYQHDEVQSFHLSVAEQDLQRMHAALPERIFVKASFRWREVSIDNVSLRFKGNSSSGPAQQHKRSYLVKFNEHDKDLRFLGLRRVSFDNGVQFGSLFSEPIITEILLDQGIPVHRCNYARLY
ncbi:MAG: CotH kinase family protein [Planctomycetota bacterium]|nr:CotH kinase family protein [Planctomycetota bacterium]